MLYDRRDFGLLRLAGAYQWLPLAPLRALSPLKQNRVRPKWQELIQGGMTTWAGM